MADYWPGRQEAMYKAGEMQVNEYFKKLEKAFNQTKRELQKTVESFYFRYAEENGLSYAAAQKQLDKAEIGELQDFIDLTMQNIGKYNQDVNNMSIKARMTRYQALEAQVDAMLRQLYAVDYQANGEKMMQDVYADTYSRTWYNIDRYRGFHSNFAQVDTRAVDKLLEYPFNGANFSDRLWKQKDHLQSQLMESITTMMIQGVPPQNLAADFAKKMQSKKFDAYRLLHTESSFLMSEATHAGYVEDGVEKYQILATLDSKTCGICGDLDGKVYKTDEAVTGVNMPPFHCFCRCTDVPYYDDTDLSDQTRAARDADGNPIEVPADMTYAEWKKAFVGGDKSGIVPTAPQGSGSVSLAGMSTDGYSSSQQKDIQNLLDAAPQDVKDLYQKFGSQVQSVDENVQAGHTAYYDPTDGRVHFHKADVAKGSSYKKPYQTHFHEYAHNMDYLAGGGKPYSVSYRNGSGKSFEDVIMENWDKTMKDFYKTSAGDKDGVYMKLFDLQLQTGGVGAESNVMQLLRDWRRLNGISRDDPVFKALKNELLSFGGAEDQIRQFYLKNFEKFGDLVYDKSETLRTFIDYMNANYDEIESGNLSDMLEPYAVKLIGKEYPLGIGHGTAYASTPGNLAVETFAEMMDATVTNSDALDLIKKYLPDAYQEYLTMMGEMIK